MNITVKVTQMQYFDALDKVNGFLFQNHQIEYVDLKVVGGETTPVKYILIYKTDVKREVR